MVSILQKNNITPYIVATATKKGVVLKKDGRYIKDIDSSLVISKLNPILQELASRSGGKYYQLDQTLSAIEQLSSDLYDNNTHKVDLKVKSYTELFTIPLLFALFVYLSAVTKIYQLFVFVLIFFPYYKADASLLDSYYITQAKESFQHKEYIKAAKYFQKTAPSVKSYYNIATSYAKAKHYKTALNYYSQIQTRNIKLKQMILYNMANCAVALKRYDRAKQLYIQALALAKDDDALANLRTLQKLRLKTPKNISDILPPKNPHKKSNSSKKTSTQNQNQKNSGGKNNSQQTTDQSSQGSGSQTKKTNPPQKHNTQHKNIYKIGYKAYEHLNKGYTNEHKPW
jgi:Ca-activated chloride channel family protein